MILDDEEGLLRDAKKLVNLKTPLESTDNEISVKIEGVLKINYAENTLKIIF